VSWVIGFSTGPYENQTVTFSTQCDSAAADLFSDGPSVDAAGVMTFTPAKDAFGSSNCNVTLAEAGEGGLSTTAGLSIELKPVNDPPSFTPGNAIINVLGDSNPYSAAWATNISSEDSPLFSAGPAISAVGVLSFTPAKFKSCSTNCTVTLAEVGENGLKATAPMTILVTDGEPGAQQEDNNALCVLFSCKLPLPICWGSAAAACSNCKRLADATADCLGTACAQQLPRLCLAWRMPAVFSNPVPAIYLVLLLQ
jgi:hypothetical protein